MTFTPITIETTVNAPVEKVWQIWTDTNHIIKWNSASPEWHTPRATHDLKPGGKFVYRMEARDGSAGFDLGGVFDEVIPNEKISYTLEDNRKVTVNFTKEGEATKIVETFEAEKENTLELQRNGWQAILDSFKSHTEKHK